VVRINKEINTKYIKEYLHKFIVKNNKAELQRGKPLCNSCVKNDVMDKFKVQLGVIPELIFKLFYRLVLDYYLLANITGLAIYTKRGQE